MIEYLSHRTRGRGIVPIRFLGKEQVTIPVEFRRTLRIGEGTPLDVALEERRIVLTPLRPEENALREYTDEEITRFLEEDKLSPEIADRVRELIKTGDL